MVVVDDVVVELPGWRTGSLALLLIVAALVTTASCTAVREQPAEIQIDYDARNSDFLEDLRTPPQLPFDAQPLTKNDAYRIIEWAGRCADTFGWQIAAAERARDLERVEAYRRMHALYAKNVLRIAGALDLDCDSAVSVALDAKLYDGYFHEMPEPSQMAAAHAQACAAVLEPYLAFVERLPAQPCTPTGSLRLR